MHQLVVVVVSCRARYPGLLMKPQASLKYFTAPGSHGPRSN
jgi:hypothetical protein